MDRYWRRNIRRGASLALDGSANLSKEASAGVLGVNLPTEDEADAIEVVKMEEWSATFLEFLQLSWFRRLWILQEFVLGRDVSMIFGHRHVPWGRLWAGTVRYQGVGMPWDSIAFAKAENADLVTSFNSMCFIRICRTIDPNTDHGREFKQIDDVFMGGTDSIEAQLPMCIVAGRYKQCTIPIDRYYAILGLLEGGEELQADYTAPMRGITMWFWKRALQFASGGELILVAGMAGQSPGYPSWLRDVSIPNPLSQLWQLGPPANSRHHAGGSPSTWSARFSDDQPDVMITQGYFIDEISEMSIDKPSDPFELEPMAIGIEKAMSFFTSGLQTANSRYPLTGEDIQDAATKVLFDYSTQEATETFNMVLQMASSLLSVAQAYPNRGQEMTDKIRAIVKDKEDVRWRLFTGMCFTRGLRFCKTSRGMFGMLPKEVRAGDLVWILKGCRLPLVLRPNSCHVGTFEMVGCGSVYGLMSGEVLQIPEFHCQEITLR